VTTPPIPAFDAAGFPVEDALRRVETAIAGHPKAGLFQLADEGFGDPFCVLVACILSIRTTDEAAVPAARRLFALGRTPAEIAALDVSAIDAAIAACQYHETKAGQIQVIARRVRDEFCGNLPCDFDVLTSFHGVGPKCAGLALGIGCGQARISVDVHVHRVTNRWGLVQTRTPEQTLAALETRVSRERWIDVNRLLMPFGKFVCEGALPRCSTCPCLPICPQIGITRHR